MATTALTDYVAGSGKTAIMWLQEICVKEGCQPNYTDRDLRPSPSSPPSFEVRVAVPKFQGGSSNGSAISTNKKDAKQKAALDALVNMGIKPKDLMDMKSNKKSSDSVSSSANTSINVVEMEVDTVMRRLGDVEVSDDPTHVTELLILCEQRSLGAPTFQTVHEEGPPHKKTFHVRCDLQVGDTLFSETGIHSQKKKAKQQSAGMMLNKLKSMAPSEVEIKRMDVGDRKMLFCDNRARCHQRLAHLQHRFLDLVIREKLDELENEMGKLETLQQVEAALKMLSKENGDCFKFTFIDNPHACTTGERQSFIQLKYEPKSKLHGPPSVFLGSGMTIEDSRFKAGMEAIEFLSEVANN